MIAMNGLISVPSMKVKDVELEEPGHLKMPAAILEKMKEVDDKVA